jgi:CubicO group peptidase (beta-lactamase class C family)
VIWRFIIVFWLAHALARASEKADNKPLTWAGISTNDFTDLKDFLEPLRKEYYLPAIAAAVVTTDRLLAAGVTGRRNVGTETKVTLEDKFHIGSCTKSMTALLAALMVSEGALRTNTMVGEVFSEWQIPDETKKITLWQLLHHRSGIAHEPSAKLWEEAYTEFRGTPPQQRISYLQEALREPLEATPGRKYIYSNTGYALLGAMIEKIGGDSWEALMRQRIFEPLGLKSAGFGPPSFPGKIDQPWGHIWEDERPKAVPPQDNPVAIAPAGAVHCSIIDLARYAAFHLSAIEGRIPQIDQSLRELLYIPVKGTYAGGWVVVTRDWAGGKALTHIGSNTMFHAVIWLAPVRRLAFVVCMNVGDRENEELSQTAGDAIISALVGKYPNH